MSNNSALCQAIMSGWNNWFNFSSRASRFEFWGWMIFIGFLHALINIFLLSDVDTQYIMSNFKFLSLSFVNGVFFALYILWGIFIFISSISISFRRLHDINKSAWWSLLMFIPIIGWIILFYWQGLKKGDDFPNSFGEPTKITPLSIDILLLIVFFIISVSLNVISEKSLMELQQIERDLSVDN